MSMRLDGIELVGNAGTVLRGVRDDLTDHRARWAVTVIQVAGAVGWAVLRHRYPRAQSPDAQLVSATMKDARRAGKPNLTELRRDPAFRAAQTRLTRRAVWSLIYGIGLAAGHRLLLAESKRRETRRPHLIAGTAVATTQTGVRIATLIVETRRWKRAAA